MGLKASGKELGKLFREMQEAEFWMKQAAGQVVGIYVRDKYGKAIASSHQGHLHHGDSKIGDVYHATDGHEYIHVNGKTYNFDSTSNSWRDATN